MKIVILAALLSACSQKEPVAPYFLSETIEREDGTTLTVTYSGDEPPEKVFPWLHESETPIP